MATHHLYGDGSLPPAVLKRAKADVKQYSIDHEPIRWADAHMLLSKHYAFDALEAPDLSRAADKAIEHIEQALKVFTVKNDLPDFALAQLGLARMYRKRVAGNRTENLTKALAAAKTAFRLVKNPACPPAFVGALYAIIGSIYADHDFESSNSRAANQDLAIRHYLAALQRCSVHDDNDNWVQRQMIVGMIYCDRKNGKRRSNLILSIKHFREALKVFTKSRRRDDWADTHKRLALSYAALVHTVDGAESLANMSEEEYREEKSTLVEKCITSSTNALQVFSTTYSATSW
jgi:tetratricopeptide (TPR) repeat protein